MSNRHDICAVISGPTLEKAREQIEKSRGYASLLEFRLDYFTFDHSHIQALRDILRLPINFKINSDQNVESLQTLNPDYVDIDVKAPEKLFEEVSRLIPNAKIICSCHLDQMPKNLEDVAAQMRKRPAHIYKLAAMAHNALDTVRMLQFVKDASEKGEQWIGVPMGECGQFGRILGPIMGNVFTHGAPDEASVVAPGQLDVKTLVENYRCHKMDLNTVILGLIGDPVTLSVSHKTHNAYLEKNGHRGVYVKAKVTSEECREFVAAAQKIGYRGMSVTMPLKEEVMKWISVDRAADAMGAVNTLVFGSKNVAGYNTDGEGALAAIQKKISVDGKRVVILGAGGAAKAIAYCIWKAGGKIVICNRTVARAQALAEHVNGQAYRMEDFQRVAREGYDLLINCTSVGLYEDQCPVNPEDILPGRVVMEVISVPRETALVKAAIQKQCEIIYGYEMFLEQAARQFALWFAK